MEVLWRQITCVEVIRGLLRTQFRVFREFMENVTWRSIFYSKGYSLNQHSGRSNSHWKRKTRPGLCKFGGEAKVLGPWVHHVVRSGPFVLGDGQFDKGAWALSACCPCCPIWVATKQI